MRYDLDSDQQFFHETTARFLDEFSYPDAVRALRDDPVGFSPDQWRRGAELGWTSLLVSEANGGGSISGRGLVDLTLVAHEFGRHGAEGPLLATNVVAAALDRAGNPAHADLLTALVAGDAVASWAYGEAPPGDALGEIACAVRVEGDEVVVTGAKRPVEAANAAGHLLVTGRTGDGLTQVVVPTDAPGLTLRPLASVDLVRRFFAVDLDEVRLPASAVLGTVGGAADDVEHQLQQALVIMAAESVGAMQHAFDMTLEWTFDRYSFGRPLASYQEIKHRMADMKAWLEAGHGLADEAADLVEAGAPEAADRVSVAKVFLGDFGSELMQDCVQLHGGIGLTYEHDLHLYLRRQTLNRALLGTSADHRRRIADLLVARAA